MNSSLVFVSGLAVTCLTSLATVIYMQRPLRQPVYPAAPKPHNAGSGKCSLAPVGSSVRLPGRSPPG